MFKDACDEAGLQWRQEWMWRQQVADTVLFRANCHQVADLHNVEEARLKVLIMTNFDCPTLT